MLCLLPDFMGQTAYRFKGFLGQDQGVPSPTDISDQLLGDPELYQPEADERFLLAIGNMNARRKTFEAITQKAGNF